MPLCRKDAHHFPRADEVQFLDTVEHCELKFHSSTSLQGADVPRTPLLFKHAPAPPN